MDTFNYGFDFKFGNKNQVPDALSRQTELLMTLKIELQGFDYLKEQYVNDFDFVETWEKCTIHELTGRFISNRISYSTEVNYAFLEGH